MTKPKLQSNPSSSKRKRQAPALALPQLRFEELGNRDNDAVNRAFQEILNAMKAKKSGGVLSDTLDSPIISLQELEPFKSQDLTDADLKEMQRAIDKEVAAFVNSTEAAAIPIVGRIVVSTVASKTAKVICRKIRC